MPAGNDSIISPDTFTWQRDSSLPRKYACMISWNATASGIVSEIPIVSGEGPREDPTPPIAVRNSRLPMLSARFMAVTGAGDILPRPGAVPVAAGPMAIISERRDGGRGMAMLPPVDADVGVGICLPGGFPSVADEGAEILMSPNSEKISPRSA